MRDQVLRATLAGHTEQATCSAKRNHTEDIKNFHKCHPRHFWRVRSSIDIISGIGVEAFSKIDRTPVTQQYMLASTLPVSP